jgi:hypothetical protein
MIAIMMLLLLFVLGFACQVFAILSMPLSNLRLPHFDSFALLGFAGSVHQR